MSRLLPAGAEGIAVRMAAVFSAVVIVIALVASAAGCQQSKGQQMTEPEPADAMSHRFRVDVLRMESYPVQYRVVASVTARSGGHAFVLDRMEREGEVVRLFATYTLPARGDMVTMALVDHEVSHDAGTQRTEVAELHARVIERGMDSAAARYELVATEKP